MKSLILIFLLTLCSSLAYSQPSTPAISEWPLCLSESEWAMLEDQVWAETQHTVDEAVEAAVASYKAEIVRLELQIKKQERQIVWLKVGIGVSFASASAGLLWAALK